MSPVARVLVALALLTGATPAHGVVKNEILLVADGPSYIQLNLSSDVIMNFYDAVITGTSPYVFIVASQGPTATAALLSIPKRNYTVTYLQTKIPRGRSLLRVLVLGKTTIRMPASGVTGTRTIKLTKRETTSTAVLKELPDQLLTVTDDIPFQTRGDAIVVHGFSRRYETGASASYSFCVEAAEKQCLPPVLPGHPETVLYNPWKSKSSHAYVSHNGAGVGPRPIQHFLFAVPL